MTKIAITPNPNGSGTFTIAAPNSNTDRTLTLPDAAGEVATTAFVTASVDAKFEQGSAIIPTTSGTAFDVTSIPAEVQEIEVVFDQVSLNGTDRLLVQIGVAAGIVTAGYDSLGTQADTTIGRDQATNGFLIRNGSAGNAFSGAMSLRRLALGSNVWISSHVGSQGFASATTAYGGGRVTLGAELDRVRVTRTGSNTFDAGQFSVRWK